MDRHAINQALAKAIAYNQCGKQHDADKWAAQLVRLLGAHGILTPAAIALTPEGYQTRLSL